MTLHFAPATLGSGTAYLFPGQGTQVVGMGQELYDHSKAARSVFHEVDMALGRPLSKMLFEGPDDALKETINAQPAIMAVSLASVKAMEEHLGPDSVPSPEFVAGHSLFVRAPRIAQRSRRLPQAARP